jgi:radical SAM protein with 4Fe4S-binding SPASM domain
MDDFFVQWHITNACNLRCQHCYQDDFSKDRDLPFPELQKISANLLAAIGEWKRKACIHLTGGEPLLKPEIFSLLEYLDRSPVVEELGIITNGLLLNKEMAERLAEFPKLRKIKVSLDGPDAATNDSIRPVGTFQRLRHSLAGIQSPRRFEIILMFTAMNRNFHSLPAYIRLAREWQVNGLIIERFIPWGKGKGIRDDVLTREQWRKMVASLYEEFDLEMGDQDFSPYQAFQIDFQGDQPELLGAPCVLGSEGLCVMPEGTVFPCRRFPLAIGNLLKDSLITIWEKSEVLKSVRGKENLKGKCGSCRIQECTGCRSLAYALTGDFLAEDPHCWYDPSYSALIKEGIG